MVTEELLADEAIFAMDMEEDEHEDYDEDSDIDEEDLDNADFGDDEEY